MRNVGRYFGTLVIAILLVVLGGVGGYRLGQTGVRPTTVQQAFSLITNKQPPVSVRNVSMDPFWEVWQELEGNYLHPDNLDAEAMVYGATQGLAASLNDPYTVYLPPEEDQRAAEELAGSFGGVGIELGYRDEILAVVAPLKGTPAEAAGIQAGDLILRVKDAAKNLDSDTSNWSLAEAVSHIRGDRGTQVTLVLAREGDTQPKEVVLTRGEIVVTSVEVVFVESANKRVAHIQLSRFGERTKEEWNQVVAQIVAQPNLDGIILDLRNNPGGFFDGAILVASDFIPQGVVVSQKGKFTSQDYQSLGTGRLAAFPVEVLVNRGSASASEIVAGALRDRKGALLIGETTFGKGSIQDRKHLRSGGGLHVTVAKWLLPKGDSIEETGIPVDIEMADDPETEADEVLERAIVEL